MLISRLPALAVLLAMVGHPVPANAFGPHDFSGSTAYPNLATRAAISICMTCHWRNVQSFGSEAGNDFPDGIAVVTDPDYRVVRDDGATVGPRRNPSLPPAMDCLGCHDGVIRTSTGVDFMPVPDPRSMSLNLDWSAGGAHNIWMMGQDSAYHPVEIHYPPDPEEEMWPGFRTLFINGDNNRVLTDGAWTIVDPTLSPSGLPLVTDPADPAKGYISCITCHNPHGTGEDFLRVDWPNLCFMCHRRSTTAPTASASTTPGPTPGAPGATSRALPGELGSGTAAPAAKPTANTRAAWKNYFWDLSRKR